MSKVLLGLLAVILVASCATVGDINASLSPTLLNAEADRYNGREVLVYGYMQSESHNSGIWLSKEAMLRGDYKNCVSLVVPEDMDTTGFHDAYVVVRAKFTNRASSNFVSLGACNFTYLRLLSSPGLAPRKKPLSWPNNSFKPNPHQGGA